MTEVARSQFETSPAEFAFSGELGTRVRNTLANRLRQVIANPLMLDGFVTKDLAFPWRKKFSDQSWEGEVSYAWLGEHIGKWLHASTVLALSVGDDEMLQLVRQYADVLVARQDSDGYLGTYDVQTRFSAPYESHASKSWDVWVHRYHVYGLLIAYRHLGDTKYLAAAEKIVDLIAATFGPGGRSLADEGTKVGINALTMIESVMLLHETTRQPRTLELARHLIYESSEQRTRLLSGLLSRGETNAIGRGKAYGVMATLLGLARYYRASGDEAVLDAVVNGWEDVKYRHLHVTGGPWSTETALDTNKECFADATYWTPGRIVENCSATTWIQLNALLLEITGRTRYADEMERAFLNQHLGSHTPDCGKGTYFTSPNEEWRGFSDALHCCNSSWPRVYACLITHAVMRTERGLAVNVYADSRLATTLANGNSVDVAQSVRVVGDDFVVSLTTNATAATPFPMQFRIPYWTRNAQIRIDGAAQVGPFLAGTAAAFERNWQGMHAIELVFPMQLQATVKSHFMARVVSFRYGPWVLAAGGVGGLECSRLLPIDIDLVDEVTGQVVLEKLDDPGDAPVAFRLRLRPLPKVQDNEKAVDEVAIRPYGSVGARHRVVTTWFAV